MSSSATAAFTDCAVQTLSRTRKLAWTRSQNVIDDLVGDSVELPKMLLSLWFGRIYI